MDDSGEDNVVYSKAVNRQVYKLCLLGATNRELADFFRITENTFTKWVENHLELYQAMMEGKLLADAKVAEALFKRATGYSHSEEKIFQYEGVPVVVPTRKHYPPDTKAAETWLRLRQRDNWRDVPDADVEQTGSFKLRVLLDPKGVDDGFELPQSDSD